MTIRISKTFTEITTITMNVRELISFLTPDVPNPKNLMIYGEHNGEVLTFSAEGPIKIVIRSAKDS